MHVNNRPQIVSFAMKALASAVASAVLLSSSAYAAGLGKLTVMSSLGQPLRAEIELTAVTNEEASGLVAKLASPDAFRLANIDFNPALLSLRFAIEQRGGRQIVKITSSQPLNEPFVDMLLELSWESGRLVREYTFLLDPAELRTTQPAQVAPAANNSARTTPAPTAAAAAPAAETRPAAQPAAPVQQQQSAPRAERRSAPAVSEYRVKPGDTLGRIAAEVKPVDISLDMMLVALYRANPDAFAGQNMNRLKAGRILSVPDSGAIRGTGDGEARGVVVAHAADFNAYRNKLAGQVATSAATKAPDAGQSAAGKITARVEERPTAVNESKDKLQLSRAAQATAGQGKTSAASEEDRIAKDKALAEATARVKELERNVNELEKLMTVKSKAGVEAATVAAPAAAPAVAAAAAPAPAAAPAQVPPPIKTVAKPAPVAEPSFADMLMDNINYVLAGLGVLLLALVGISAARRRKETADQGPTEPSILGAPTDQAHSMFAEAGGQSVDTNNSVFNSSFAPSASQLDTNEVDPVAEADVYIAYGRDAQAEEILKEALRTHPERNPVRLKLLEIYAARKDQRAFEAQASEMYGITKGQGDDWAQAAALGVMLDPLNPLYAGAAGAAVAAVPDEEERSQPVVLAQEFGEAPGAADSTNSTMDFDLGLGDTRDEPTPLDVPAAAPLASASAEDHSLDFDLGGLSFEPVTQSDPIAMPAADDTRLADEAPAPVPAAVESAYDMDFDMSFDSPSADQPTAVPAPAPTTAFTDIDLDLGQDSTARGEPVQDYGTVDLSDFDVPAAAAGSEAAAATRSDSLLELDMMNFDLPSATAAPVTETGARDEGLQFKEEFALPDMPFEPLDETPQAPLAAPAAPQFDMSGINLDLPPADEHDTALPDLNEIDRLDDSNDGIDDISTADMEMETKLDLAIAYQEIGDKEGARELLDEVIKGGNAAQVGKANEMRAKLG